MLDVLAVLLLAALVATGLWLALRGFFGRPAGRRRAAARLAVVAIVALAAAASGAFAISRSPTVQLLGDHAARVDTDDLVVALTFDDGPDSSHTADVVRVLNEYDVKATFYVTGAEASKAPAALRMLVAAGHEIGNHSYSHPRLLAMSQTAIAQQVEATDALIRAAGYEGEITFRPPYGKRLVAAAFYLRRHGRMTVTWDVAPDSDLPSASAEELVGVALDQVRPGSIVLMHVMYDGRESSRAALAGIIVGLRAKGYRFVTVGELLRRR